MIQSETSSQKFHIQETKHWLAGFEIDPLFQDRY